MTACPCRHSRPSLRFGINSGGNPLAGRMQYAPTRISPAGGGVPQGRGWVSANCEVEIHRLTPFDRLREHCGYSRAVLRTIECHLLDPVRGLILVEKTAIPVDPVWGRTAENHIFFYQYGVPSGTDYKTARAGYPIISANSSIVLFSKTVFVKSVYSFQSGVSKKALSISTLE